MQGRECVWTHPELGIILSVYVGEFQMARPQSNFKDGWDLIRKSGIALDPPTPRDHYLGRGQKTNEVTDADFGRRTQTIRLMLPKHSTNDFKTAKDVRGTRWDMRGFTDWRSDRYLDVAAEPPANSRPWPRSPSRPMATPAAGHITSPCGPGARH